jgi:hypothetical protein
VCPFFSLFIRKKEANSPWVVSKVGFNQSCWPSNFYPPLGLSPLWLDLRLYGIFHLVTGKTWSGNLSVALLRAHDRRYRWGLWSWNPLHQCYHNSASMSAWSLLLQFYVASLSSFCLTWLFENDVQQHWLSATSRLVNSVFMCFPPKNLPIIFKHSKFSKWK